MKNIFLNIAHLLVKERHPSTSVGCPAKFIYLDVGFSKNFKQGEFYA